MAAFPLVVRVPSGIQFCTINSVVCPRPSCRYEPTKEKPFRALAACGTCSPHHIDAECPACGQRYYVAAIRIAGGCARPEARPDAAGAEATAAPAAAGEQR